MAEGAEARSWLDAALLLRASRDRMNADFYMISSLQQIQDLTAWAHNDSGPQLRDELYLKRP